MIYSMIDDYVNGKKLRLLYYIQEMLYSYIRFRTDVDHHEWRFFEGDGIEVFGMAELKGTELLSVNKRLQMHKYYYRLYKPTDIIVGRNGQQLLMDESWFA